MRYLPGVHTYHVARDGKQWGLQSRHTGKFRPERFPTKAAATAELRRLQSIALGVLKDFGFPLR